MVLLLPLGGGMAGLFLGQGELPLLWGEMLPAMAACYPLTLEQRLAYTQGETLPFLGMLLMGDCSFDPLVVRFPALLAGALTLLFLAYARRSVRSWGERFFSTALMAGTPAFLFYSHVTRPYEYLLLSGTVIWLYRGGGSPLPRLLLAPLSLLGVPFAAPLYGAVLLREFLFPETQPRSLRVWLLLELLLAGAALTWEILILMGPAQVFLNTWMRVRGWQGASLHTLIQDFLYLTVYDGDPLGIFAFGSLLLLALPGLWQKKRDLILLGFTALLYTFAIHFFKPQVTARFFLALYPVLVSEAGRTLVPMVKLPFDTTKAGILEPVPEKRSLVLNLAALVMGLSILGNAGRTSFLYIKHTPELYTRVELRPPLSEILAVVRDGDIIIGDESWFLDQLYIPLLTKRAVEFWIYRSGFYPPLSEPWIGGEPYRFFAYQKLPWLKLTGVKVFSRAEELLAEARNATAQGKRLVSLGFLSAPSHLCHQPCPRIPEMQKLPLIVMEDRTLNPETRERICSHKVPLLILSHHAPGMELLYPLAPLFRDPALTQAVRRSLCPG